MVSIWAMIPLYCAMDMDTANIMVGYWHGTREDANSTLAQAPNFLQHSKKGMALSINAT